MRILCPEDPPVEHPVKGEIVCKLGSACYLGNGIDPTYRVVYYLKGAHVIYRLHSP